MDCTPYDYAFGAYNSSTTAGVTYLTARILSRKDDEPSLHVLACDDEVYEVLARRNLKFGEQRSGELTLAIGPERGFIRESPCPSPDGSPRPLVPISITGMVPRDKVDYLLATGERGESSPFRDADAGLSLYLRPGEVQQLFLRLAAKTEGAYAVQIDHWVSAAKEEYIGGITALFLTPHDPF